MEVPDDFVFHCMILFFRFSVNPKTGVVVVANCKDPGMPQCLDYETKSVYDLTYKVRLMGNSLL